MKLSELQARAQEAARAVREAEDELDRAEAEELRADEAAAKLRNEHAEKKAHEKVITKVREWLDRQALLGMAREHQAVVERLIEDLR